MFGTAVQYGGHSVGFLSFEGVGHPGGATAEGIVEVPAEGDHATAVVVGDSLLTDAPEGYTIEVEGVAELDVSEVEAKEGGMVVADAMDVGALMDGGVGCVVGLPPNAVDGGIVMSEEIDGRVAQCLQIAKQVFCALGTSAVGQRIVSFLMIAAARGKNQCGGNYKEIFLHT